MVKNHRIRWGAGLLTALLLLNGCSNTHPLQVVSHPTTTIGTTTATTTTTTTTTTKATSKATTKKTSKATTKTATELTTIATTTATIDTTDSTTTPSEKDFAFSPQQVAQLNQLIGSYSGHVSVAFYDITSGYTYTYQPNHSYFVASIIKAPYCMYILSLAEQGKIRLSDTIQYTKDFYANGTGLLKKQQVGGYYSIDTLTEYAIRYSDNVALRMLRSQFPAQGFTAFAKEIGIQNTSDIKNINNGNITATDALVYMKAIHRFIYSGSTYGQKLRTDMLRTSNPMIQSSYPVVRKYGWANNSFHDMAIVEAPSPYILVILSDHDQGTSQDFAMFKTISKRIESYAKR